MIQPKSKQKLFLTKQNANNNEENSENRSISRAMSSQRLRTPSQSTERYSRMGRFGSPNRLGVMTPQARIDNLSDKK